MILVDFLVDPFAQVLCENIAKGSFCLYVFSAGRRWFTIAH